MSKLRNLIEKLNRVWYVNSRIVPVLETKRGTGTHRLMTINEGVMYLHSLPFSEKLEQVQEIVLQDLTVHDTVIFLRDMGYEANVLPEAINEGIHEESALIALDFRNRPIEGERVYAFTSNLWKFMYPIHRKIAEAEGDLDEAIEQLLLPSAKGFWLDYWVSFFNIKRLPEETDEMLLRRALMTITSVKSNNVAMEELIGFYIGANVAVNDYEPSLIEVRISPQYMDDSITQIRDLVATLKSAGTDFIVNYASQFSENYKTHFRNMNGERFSEVNKSPMKGSVKFPIYEDNYSQIPNDRALSGFTIGVSSLNSGAMLSVSDKRILTRLRMKMTENGQVIKEM